MAWAFTLKPGIQFHNGKPVTSADVARLIELFRATEGAYLVDATASVETPDDLTVRFVMINPDPDAVAALGEDCRVTGAVGAGAFKLASFTLGQETVLFRNDDCAWGAALSANTGPARRAPVTCREIPKGSTAFLALWSGGVDGLLSLPTDFLGEISADAKLAIAPISGQIVY